MRSRTVASEAVAAVVVTYDCGPELLENINILLMQVDRIFVVDNGSAQPAERHLAQLERAGQVDLIRLGMNFGIAKALNVGLRAVLDAGYLWALTMDQDSRPDEMMVSNLLRGLGRYDGGEGRVAMIAPIIRGAHDGLLIQGWHESANSELPVPSRTMICMTSGALTNVACWEKVGGFLEEFFIDCVDNEYCLRCISEGWSVLQDFHATLYHNLGRRRKHYLTKTLSFNATHHSSLRRYFITRNRIATWRLYRTKYPRYVCDDIKNALIESFKILLVEDDKWKKFLAIVRGIRDGLRWRTRRV